MSRLIIIATLLIASVATVSAEPFRLDTYDSRSRRTGYIVVDPTTKRVDLYDRNSNRRGFGTLSTEGDRISVDLYRPNGKRSDVRIEERSWRAR